ncbi:sigma-70 family RNA polymerase sigma factor [Amedibacillus sp. YH-ame10]
MNDYNRNSFYTIKDENTGKKRFYIKVHHDKVEVSKEVFNVCFNAYRKELRDNRMNEMYGLISLDSENEKGQTLLNLQAVDTDIIEIISNHTKVVDVLKIINELDIEDKYLITELLLNDRKEKELAQYFLVTQQEINRRKHAIIKKIRDKYQKSIVKEKMC